MPCQQCRISHAPDFLDGCSLHSSARSGLLSSSFSTRARIVARVQAWRRLQARHLRPVDRLLPEARRGQRSADAGRSRTDVVRASVVLRARVERRRTWPTSSSIAQIAQRLAHPDGLTDAEAHRLAQEGKAFVHIDGGLHSTEVAGGQHTLQLAYDLARARGRSRRSRRSSTTSILMLWPTINPDGQQMVAEVVHAETSARRTRPRRCRSSIRNTSATTTTATPTC